MMYVVFARTSVDSIGNQQRMCMQHAHRLPWRNKRCCVAGNYLCHFWRRDYVSTTICPSAS